MYSIKKVSEMLGIPTVTIRAWEKRYQIINPVRSNGGHRLYSEEDINTLNWIKNQMDEKDLKISEAVSLLKQKTVDRVADVELYTIKKERDNLIEMLYQDLIGLNTIKAHKTIDLAFSLYNYVDVFHNILAPVLYRIGTEWEDGKIAVAQEHFSSQIIMQRCSQFLWSLPIQPNLPKGLSLCPEGEHHQMGLMLFSLFLRNKGLDITYLGPDTPLNELPAIIRMKDISLVVISITNPDNIEELEAWVKTCRRDFPDVKIVLGGTGFQNQRTTMSSYVLPDKVSDWETWYTSTIDK
ncbi:MerR family transcriptional regulator [Ornithinibacillus xuwenensis]|jgi:MerR family transcriptional regulator, light-induced transcriptional regulator|uniref:MerR family transcriptional regulator n=1 Tax=Ornithinibacillus xuwenensis TaxID=3144668 RepID=A0ABU9XK34_9BACI